MLESELRRTSGAAGAATPTRRGRLALGGAAGNNRLTSLLGMILLIVLAIEGATILRIQQLLSVHVFVGMLLLGPVAVKLASTGYRFARYYTGGPEYVKLGPPQPLMRFLVAPVLVLSTVILFGTGVTLLAVPHRGLVLTLHKGSFIVWFGATSIHVLAYIARAVRSLLAEASGNLPGGKWLRLGIAALAIAAGVGIAVATYPLAHPWFHHGFFFGGHGG